MTHRTLIGSALYAGLVLSAACGGGTTPPKTAGAPTQIVTTVTGLTAPANTNIATPIVLTVEDAAGTPVANQQVTFAITAGGGTLSGPVTATSDANGQVTAPTWKVGKSAIPQTLTATLGTITKDVNATILTNFAIDIRFFGSRPVSAAHQALFTAAAQRLMAIVTADVPAVTGQIDMKPCGVNQVLNETIDDVVIFASSDTIDGPGKILGQAGPCYIRDPGVHSTITGVMQFDKDDLDQLLTNGLAQDVITHEMLHVLGVGTLWNLSTTTPPQALLTGAGTIDPRYVGTEGRAGCQAVGGTTTCATSVPVEGNDQAAGTRDSHWREKTPASPGANNFNNELMTGFLNSGSNPLSQLTLRSLTDLGYTVNTADFDAYTIPGGALRASSEGSMQLGVPAPLASIQLSGREILLAPKFGMSRNGQVTRLPERK